MKILPASEEAIAEAVLVIKNGGVVAHATETCYGLACDLTNKNALEKLFAIKKRPKDQPVSALFSSVEEAKKWVAWNDQAKNLADKYLPGPLTVIVPVQKNVQMYVQLFQEKHDSVGVRVSSHPVAQKLAELSGVPLSTTSANIVAQKECYSANEVFDHFADHTQQPDIVLDSGELEQRRSSTIVDVSHGNPNILRQGAVHL